MKNLKQEVLEMIDTYKNGQYSKHDQKSSIKNLTPEEQTEELCLQAVKEDGLALQYVYNQTYPICLEAVKQNGLALKYVKEQTNHICLEAVMTNGLTLKFVKVQTPEICLTAVKQTKWALMDVENQTEEVCLEAVKQDGNMLRYVFKDYHTLKVYHAAISENIEAIQYIDEELFEKCNY